MLPRNAPTTLFFSCSFVVREFVNALETILKVPGDFFWIEIYATKIDAAKKIAPWCEPFGPRDPYASHTINGRSPLTPMHAWSRSVHYNSLSQCSHCQQVARSNEVSQILDDSGLYHLQHFASRTVEAWNAYVGKQSYIGPMNIWLFNFYTRRLKVCVIISKDILRSSRGI